MSNGPSLTSITKNYIVDYRNGKYQGEISEYGRVPHGMGILLSIDYLIVIAKWQAGTVRGECLLFYPNGRIFYGRVVDNQPEGVCAFQVSKHRTLYTFPKQGEPSLVIADCQLRHTLTLSKLSTQALSNMLCPPSDSPETEWIFDENKQANKDISIMDIRTYSSDNQKWQLLQKLSGQTLKSQLKGYKQFIKLHFNARVTPKDKRLEIIQAKEYTEIRYKKAGIVCRVSDRGNRANRIQMMGIYDSYAEECDVFIKNKEGIQPELEEYCEGHSIAYRKDRPTACRTNLLNYFRKSTNFINRFVEVQRFDHLQTFYSQIDGLIDGQLSMKTAQLQLEMGGHDETSPLEENPPKPRPSHNQSSYQTFGLQDMRTDIYSRVNRKRTSNVSHSYVSPLKSLKNQNTVSMYSFKEDYDDPSPSSSKYGRHHEQTGSRHSKSYLKYTQPEPTVISRYQPSKKYDSPSANQKRYSYLPKDDEPQNYRPISKELTRNRSQMQIDLSHIRHHNHSYQRSHNQENGLHRHSRNDVNQSIGTLTNNYAKITSELRAKGYSRERRGQQGMSRRKYEGTSPSYYSPTPRTVAGYHHSRSPVQSPHQASGRSRRQWR